MNFLFSNMRFIVMFVTAVCVLFIIIIIIIIIIIKRLPWIQIWNNKYGQEQKKKQQQQKCYCY